MKKAQQKFTGHSFKRGAGLVPIRQYAAFRQELMNAWGIVGTTTWYMRLRGERELSPCEREAAERIFAKYGVDKSQIWGCEDGPASTSVED